MRIALAYGLSPRATRGQHRGRSRGGSRLVARGKRPRFNVSKTCMLFAPVRSVRWLADFRYPRTSVIRPATQISIGGVPMKSCSNRLLSLASCGTQNTSSVLLNHFISLMSHNHQQYPYSPPRIIQS